jgi:RNA exonuclease 1
VPECSNTNIPLQNKILIIDCEMVICDNNFELARTSIMNFEGELIYDEFFMPDTEITNYNTQYSGITEEILRNVKKKI